MISVFYHFTVFETALCRALFIGIMVLICRILRKFLYERYKIEFLARAKAIH